MRRLAPLFAAALIAGCASQTPDNAANQSAGDTQAGLPLVIRTNGTSHRFSVEVALTAQDQAKGLMFRKELARDSGMLFPMFPPRTASFWMENTLIPLDMLFIRTDGTIAFIQANAVPYSREPVSAGVPVAAVLELPGGRAAELGIHEGDRVAWGPCAVENRPVKARDRLNFCPA